ncbi:MAG: AMP-binding protein, partial [Myxococcales bacterium]|nr:AMP-binding protein [Myxococcales bacterium]
GLDAFTAFMLELTGLGPADRVLRVAELAFDLAWFDHLATWRAGACLATLPRRALVGGRALSVAVRAARPSVVYAVPSFFAKLASALASEGGWPDAPRMLCFAGETYPPRALAELAALAPRARLANLFGPTETNVCTYHVVGPGELDGERELPIGLATPYCRCTLVGDDGVALAGEGEGELVVEGPTALGGRHATGDRVARGADGLFRFRGRRDRLVKLAGHRVELGEVEAALARHPAVREAAVLAAKDARRGPALVAFAACAPDASADARSLRAHVATLLPPYMVPERVVVMGALPRTPNGKIDYRALED